MRDQLKDISQGVQKYAALGTKAYLERLMDEFFRRNELFG